MDGRKCTEQEQAQWCKCTHHSSYSIFTLQHVKLWLDRSSQCMSCIMKSNSCYRSGGWRLQSWLIAAIRILSNRQDHCHPSPPFFYIIYLSPSLVVLFVLLYLSISLFSVPVCLFFSQPIHIILPLLPPPTNTHRYEHTDFIRLRWVGLL